MVVQQILNKLNDGRVILLGTRLQIHQHHDRSRGSVADVRLYEKPAPRLCAGKMVSFGIKRRLGGLKGLSDNWGRLQHLLQPCLEQML